MKANELMIGDWVNLRVEEDNFSDNISVTSTDLGNHYILKHIEPIPLTEEILEKNGFAIRYNRYEDEHKTVIRKYREGWLIDRHYSFHCAVKYIHELQHALKLCGIEKDITL